MLLRIGVGVGCKLGSMRRQNNGVACPWESIAGAHVGFRERLLGLGTAFLDFMRTVYIILLNSSLPSELPSLPSTDENSTSIDQILTCIPSEQHFPLFRKHLIQVPN